MNRDELAARLLASFLDELDEQVRVMNAELLALEHDEPTGERLRGLFRIAHTLKGAARAAGAPSVERLCHEMESLLAAARAGSIALGADQFATLFAAADTLEDAGRRLRAGESLEDSRMAAVTAALSGMPVQQHPIGGKSNPVGSPRPRNREAGSHEPPAHMMTPVSARGAVAVPDQGDHREPAPAAGGQPSRAVAEASVRVDADKLDGLLASVGTLALTRGAGASERDDVDAVAAETSRWAAEWRRRARHARRHLDGASGDAASLLEEAELQLDRLTRQLGRAAAGAARRERALRAATEDIGERVRLLRLRPFVDVTEALPRVVRDVATALGRDVQLEIRGLAVEADRAVLNAVREPLLHLVRNAVDHGIEAPTVRIAHGKPMRGTVVLDATLRGDRLMITVSDDGAGVDEDALRAALARARRDFGADARGLAQALLQGGISTRTEATAISGRGVGLDLVRTAIERLGGSLDVSWVRGQGTRFTVECPVMLARIRAVIVGVGAQQVAFPAVHVERMQRLRRSQLRRVTGADVMLADEVIAGAPASATADGVESPAPVRVVTLARLLGTPFVDKPVPDPMPIVVVTTAGARLAIVVDELVDEQELIVRPLPRGFRVSPHVAGAGLLPSGGAALVMNTASLMSAGLASGAMGPTLGHRPQVRRRVLVADDSVTTRTLEQSVLEAAGYEVITAVDGADAWRILEEQECDLVVSDVEMPRMDGFALCEAIRGSRRLARLPVVLVTAQEAPEHRARGLEAGADAYIGKSGFDQQDLINVVRDLLP